MGGCASSWGAFYSVPFLFIDCLLLTGWFFLEGAFVVVWSLRSELSAGKWQSVCCPLRWLCVRVQPQWWGWCHGGPLWSSCPITQVQGHAQPSAGIPTGPHSGHPRNPVGGPGGGPQAVWTCKAGMYQPRGLGCPCPAGLSHSAPCPGLWQGQLSF